MDTNSLERRTSRVVGTKAPTESGRLLARLPSLDGWRAVSITLVLGAHCKTAAGFPALLDALFNWLFDGELGVRVFFIISGLLITWLLLDERERTGRLNLPHFYARRALRILPVYIAFLGVLGCLQYCTPFEQSMGVWLGNLTFTTNFNSGSSWVSDHLWSIAVEEQFYVIWPSLLLGIAALTGLAVKIRVLLVPILIAPVVRVVSYLGLAPAGYEWILSGRSFLKYFDSLAIGCLCAVLLARLRSEVAKRIAGQPRTWIGVALLLIFVPYSLTRFLVLGGITVPFGPTLQGTGLALLLVQSILFPRLGFYDALNWPVVRHLGVLSYSLYIWQQLFCTSPVFFGLDNVWWMSFPGWLLPAFVAACLSYYGLERPLLRLRARFRA